MLNSKEAEDLKKRIYESEIISFDIFDTLLLRNVINPTDIFKAIEKEYLNKKNIKIDFYKIRIEAERQARQNTKNEDILFEDIYSIIEKKMGSIAKELSDMEVQLEKKFLIANKVMKQVYDLAIALNKKIYIISDMYLPVEIIDELLYLNGYTGYNKLFVSSELKVTKATGSMYRYIREIENIEENQKWLHIGDNYQSDYINANKNGIQGCYYKKFSEREKVNNIYTLGDSILRAIQLNNKYTNINDDYWYNFGLDIVSPIYTGIMYWLVDHIKDKDNIFFLSRDGYIPYKLYKKMKGHYKNLPKENYIYASRRAYIYPRLLKTNKEEAMETLTAYNANLDQKLTVREILNNIGLIPENYEKKVNNFNIKSLDDLVNEKTIKYVKEFLNSIWKDICVVLEKELMLLEAYLDEINISDYEKINIFDIGWRGSTHLAIKDILKKPVNGYYFGTLENIYEEIKEASYGYAFNAGIPINNRTFIMDNIMMYELIFSSPEGSLINFQYDQDNKLIPNLKNVEKNEFIYSIIDKLQQGAINIFVQAINYNTYIRDISKQFSLSAMKNFITSYNVNDMLEFSKLSNSVGFGNSVDIKQYVSIIDENEYLLNKNMYINRAKYNLWKHAIIIKDDYERCFNKYEIDKLRRKTYKLPTEFVGRYFNILIKAIRSPKKAVVKISKITKEIFM